MSLFVLLTIFLSHLPFQLSIQPLRYLKYLALIVVCLGFGSVGLGLTPNNGFFVYHPAQHSDSDVEIGISRNYFSKPDSVISDTILSDTSAFTDTAKVIKGSTWVKFSKDTLDQKIHYQSTDSLKYQIAKKKGILYGEAKVTYGQIKLEAAIIEFDWEKNTVHAYGREDSMGKLTGLPVFADGEESFTAKRLAYNFKTKKGKIFEMFTEEGEGFIHAGEAKKDEEDNLFASKARYTTCNLDHPHFWIEATPLKIVPDKILVCGPTNLVIDGVRTPLFLPFAMFPIQQGRRSGILFPEFEQSQNYGFGLRNGGYYFALSDYFDLTLRGDLYTSGSWRINANSSFAKRYKYNGNLNVVYSRLRSGDALTGSLNIRKDFSITGSFNLNQKAWPTNNLSASINIKSGGYNELNSFDTETHLENTLNSSINYSKNFGNKPFNFNMSLRHFQNTTTGAVTLTLPEANFGIRRILPFKSKISSGEPKWYENIGFSYQANLQNRLSTTDSLLFRQETLNDFVAGMQHRIPVSGNFSLFKYINLGTNFNYTENWYLESYEKRYDPTSIGDTAVQYVFTDTIPGFSTVRSFSASVSLSTNLYGRLNFKSGPIKAIRHRITPSISFNYRPDFGAESWGYFKTVQTDPDGTEEQYYTLPTTPFGAPSTGQQAGIGFSIGNNLEMKVHSKKDTVDQTKKLKIFENITLSGAYNFAAEEFKLSTISIRGNSAIVPGLPINFGMTFDPYSTDAEGSRVDVFQWDANRQLARLTSFNLSTNTSLRSSKRKFGEEEQQERNQYGIDWDANLGYRLSLNRGAGGNPDSFRTTQSLTAGVNLQLGSKWRISANTGYDFVNNKFTYSTFNIHRDLHCWEMHFNWIPFGGTASYNFGINVRSNILKDLKVEKKSSPYDNLF